MARSNSFLSPSDKHIAADLDHSGFFLFFILEMVCCVYSLESPRRGDSNDNKQHPFMLTKIERISLLWPLA